MTNAASPRNAGDPGNSPVPSPQVRKPLTTQSRPTPYQVSIIPICQHPGTLTGAKVKAFVDGEEKKCWTTSRAVLLNSLAELLGEASTSDTLRRLNAGRSVGLPELYSSHDLCLLGYRVSRRQ